MESEKILKFIRLKNLPSCIEQKRYNHTIVTYQGSVYIFGGKMPGIAIYFNDLLRYDVKSQSWGIEVTDGSLPSPRSGHTAQVYKSSMFVFGGMTNDLMCSNDLFEYRFSTKKWSKYEFTNCDLPEARYLHSAAVYNDRLWILSGIQLAKEKPLTSMWKIRLTGDSYSNWEKVIQKDQYTEDDFVACNSVVVASNLYVFSRTSPQFFVFNFTKHTWSKPIDMPTIARMTPLVTSDQELVVFDKKKVFHCYSLNSKKWSVIPLSPDSYIPQDLVYHEAFGFGDSMYVYGGSTPDNNCNAFFHKLQWKNSFPNCSLNEDFGILLESGLFADAEFVVGYQEIKMQIHVAIIAARSEWLLVHIREAQKESGGFEYLPMLQVKLPTVFPEVFEMILSYVYTDQIKTPNAEQFLLHLELYSLAVKMKLKRLAQQIIEQLTDELLDGLVTPSNVLDILSKAHNLNLFAVKEHCLRFIRNDSNYVDVIESEKFELLDNNLIIEVVKRKMKSSNVSFLTSPNTSSSDLFGPTLAEDMQKFLNSDGQEFTDVTLLVGEHSIAVHKCILAARSSYFAEMFRSFMPSNKTVRIHIGGIKPSKEAMDVLLKFIYYDDVKVPTDLHAFILFAAPDYYGFTSNCLQAIVKENLRHNGTFEQMAKLLEEAHLTQQMDLKTYFLGLIVECYPCTSSWPRTHTFASQELWIDIIEAMVLGRNVK